jgi:hypothetical protein|nr:MAG TPA: SIR2 family protein [Caudoviricetes sp.]
MVKVGFLFGAGAEICYGLPTGGKFALDIFRQDIAPSKNEFIKMRDSIDGSTPYAGEWLPDDYKTRSVSSYGKSVIENIIKDTLEHKRDSIIQNLNDFDSYANKSKEYLKNIDDIIKDLLGRKANDCQLNSTISFNMALNKGNDIFKSHYFSALLLIYKEKKLSNPLQSELKKIIVSILQLQIGALSSTLVKNINDNIFEKKDEEIDLFDDIGEVLRLNYQSTGVIGVEYLYDNFKNKNIDEMDNNFKIVHFAKCILEEIFASVLDYKSLIDSNWHYLYCPKNEWAKFCKISIFLLSVKNYIEQNLPTDISNKGYYDDLKDIITDNLQIEVTRIATTNYNKIIAEKLQKDIIYLNGSVTQWYDPYLNKIDTFENLNGKFVVPLLFTQSGTKPMTSIFKSCEYVDLYRDWMRASYIIVIGFGFNKDDEHINGIIRTLVNDNNKKIIIVGRASKEKIIKQLIVEKTENIEVYNVDDQRNIENKLWIKYILEKIEYDSHYVR